MTVAGLVSNAFASNTPSAPADPAIKKVTPHNVGRTGKPPVEVKSRVPKEAAKRIEEDAFKSSPLASCVDLANALTGAQIIAFTDEFFAEAENMIQPHPAVSCPNRFTDRGAWMDGWETKRHNQTYDWAIVKLGFAGILRGFTIDTSHFTGNNAPRASVDAAFCPEGDIEADDVKWHELLPTVDLEPTKPQTFVLSEDWVAKHGVFTHVRLNNYPDGGIARFRVWGSVRAVWPKDPQQLVDLAFIGNEGRAVQVSDQHYGVGGNILNPGRGVNMGDGWETKRSRTPGHEDFVVVKLGAKGRLIKGEIDTKDFKGNYPNRAIVEATNSSEEVPPADAEWLPLTEMLYPQADHQHYFDSLVQDKVFTHARIRIFPDGGVKRLRLLGIRVPETIGVNDLSSSLIRIKAIPLTREAYAPFGSVIQAQSDPSNGVTAANQGTAQKSNYLVNLINARSPSGTASSLKPAKPNLCVFRCQSLVNDGQVFTTRLLERHPYSTQLFSPMGGSIGTDDRGYLVIVALPDNSKAGAPPDLSSLKAFYAHTRQGVSYSPGIWHHPMVVVGGQDIDFTVLVFENGVPDEDCQETRDGTVGIEVEW